MAYTWKGRVITKASIIKHKAMRNGMDNLTINGKPVERPISLFPTNTIPEGERMIFPMQG